MIILAIDCANFSTSLALLNNNHVLAFFKIESSYNESATLISRIKDLFKKSDLLLTQLEAVVVTTGPGSFTGIRLGMAAARGLSFALNIPLYAINSFSWVAHSYQMHFNISTNLLIALESKREEIFIAIYSENLICQQTPSFLKPEEVLNSYAVHNFKIIGDAAVYFKSEKMEMMTWMPNAVDLAHYVLKYRSSPENFDVCKPFYIRAPEIHGQS